MESMKVKVLRGGSKHWCRHHIGEVFEVTDDGEFFYRLVKEFNSPHEYERGEELDPCVFLNKQDCEIVDTERDKILTKNELELLRKDFWEFLEFDHGCLCGVHPAPCGWCTHPGNFIEDQLEDLGYTTEQIQMFKDDEPIHKILSANEKPQNDWFPGREIVQANIMQVWPDRTHQKSCGECIYYEAERCVKELTNEHGHCTKWLKSV